MRARPIDAHMNPLHPHGGKKKKRTHKWKTSNTVMSRTFYNYRKNKGGVAFTPPVISQLPYVLYRVSPRYFCTGLVYTPSARRCSYSRAA